MTGTSSSDQHSGMPAANGGPPDGSPAADDTVIAVEPDQVWLKEPAPAPDAAGDVSAAQVTGGGPARNQAVPGVPGTATPTGPAFAPAAGGVGPATPGQAAPHHQPPYVAPPNPVDATQPVPPPGAIDPAAAQHATVVFTPPPGRGGAQGAAPADGLPRPAGPAQQPPAAGPLAAQPPGAQPADPASAAPTSAATQVIGAPYQQYAGAYQQAGTPGSGWAPAGTPAAGYAAQEETRISPPLVTPAPWSGPDLVDQRQVARQRVLRWGGIAAAVVVVAAAVGLALGSAFSGGSPGNAKGAAVQGATLASEADAVNKLIDVSRGERSNIQTAVSNIRQCRSMGEAAAMLRSAAGQRQALLSQLGALKVDKLPDGPALVTTFSEAWQASATFDQEYAAYADDTAAHQCKGARGPHYEAAVQADGQATKAKNRALTLWNPVAAQVGLTTRQAWEF